MTSTLTLRNPPKPISKKVVQPATKDELRQIAINALVAVADDDEAPAAARAAAARTMLESLGDIGRLQEVARQAEKPLTEMTPRELDEEIARLRPKG
jgi:hypothetical protein